MKANLKDAKILIVDDQEANIEVLEDLLLIKGYENLKRTKDARAVLSIAMDFRPDIILLDLMMPHLSGFDVMQQLTQAGLMNGFLRILVLTADATPEIKKKALSEGASDFLTKPFDLTEVDLRIKNLLTTVYLMEQFRNQNQVLEEKVLERTAALVNANQELKDVQTRLEENLTSIQIQNQVLKGIAWSQAHVVRAPLSRLMGAVKLMQQKDFTDKVQQDMVDVVEASAKELDGIIRDISNQTYHARVLNDPA